MYQKNTRTHRKDREDYENTALWHRKWKMTGITRSRAASLMARFFGTESRHEGGAYDTYTARDEQGRKWKAMNDSSLVPQKKVNGNITDASSFYRTEVVSPILSYEDIPKLQELVRMLRKAGAFANKSCGIHIHVGAERFTAKTLRNLVNIMASKEDMIYRALQINPSRENRYCRKTNTTFLKDLNRKKPDTLDGIADLWYQEAPYGRNHHYNSTRYHGLNLHATFTKGTVEFRRFQRDTPRWENKGIHSVLPGRRSSGPGPEESLGPKDRNGQ